MEIKITKPKLASSFSVNTVVCVRKPGPIADVAIKKAAPKIADDVFVLVNLRCLNVNMIIH